MVQDTVETITLTNFPQVGPSLPHGLAGHCLVKVNDSLILAIGGRGELAKSDPWEYDLGGDELFFGVVSSRTFWHSVAWKSWITGPELMSPREGHACGTVMDPRSKTVFVIVAGGFASSDSLALATTEILSLSLEQTLMLEPVSWSPGPDLPEGLSFSRFASVSADSKLLLIGGNGADSKYRRTIYIWTCFQDDGNLAGGCQHSLSRQRLPSERSGFVPLNLVNATCTKRSDFNETSITLRNASESTCDFITTKTADEGQMNITFTRQLCCHGGQLCFDSHGRCRRDADCYGELVCGCRNCQYSCYGVFSSDDNCCASTKESCFGIFGLEY